MRADDERRLARKISKLFGEQEELALKQEDWTLFALFVGAVFAIMLDITWTKVTELWEKDVEAAPPTSMFFNVQNWLSGYSFKLVSGIEDITRSQLSLVLREYVEKGQTLGELQAAVATIFGPERAARIAVTEATRCYAEAKYEVAKQMELLGLPQRIVWETEKDELVCEICAPRDGKAEGDGWFRDGPYGIEPPAHPNCRCGIMTEVA